jgi:hypothetical protein
MKKQVRALERKWAYSLGDHCERDALPTELYPRKFFERQSNCNRERRESFAPLYNHFGITVWRVPEVLVKKIVDVLKPTRHMLVS